MVFLPLLCVWTLNGCEMNKKVRKIAAVRKNDLLKGILHAKMIFFLNKFRSKNIFIENICSKIKLS